MTDRTNPPGPETEDGHPVISAAKARQAVKVGTMRYVLGISLTLAIVAVAVVFILARR